MRASARNRDKKIPAFLSCHEGGKGGKEFGKSGKVRWTGMASDTVWRRERQRGREMER